MKLRTRVCVFIPDGINDFRTYFVESALASIYSKIGMFAIDTNNEQLAQHLRNKGFEVNNYESRYKNLTKEKRLNHIAAFEYSHFLQFGRVALDHEKKLMKIKKLNSKVFAKRLEVK